MSSQAVFSLCAEFGVQAGDFCKEVITTVAADIVKGVIVGGVAGYVMTKVHHRKTAKALMEGNFENDHAVFGQTIYSPSGVTNPATGKEFIDQKIRTIASDIELECLFPPAHRLTMTEYLLEAAKHCTHDDPIVFQHLHKVIKDPQLLDHAKKIIQQNLINHLSEKMGGNRHHALATHDPRDVAVEKTFYPLLTLEKQATIRKFRIFLITPEQLEPGNLPDPADVRVECRGEFMHDPDYYQMKRLSTYRTIAERLQEPQWQWIKEMFVMKNPTGEFKTVPVPAMLQPS